MSVDDTLYCICRRPYDGCFMIFCDGCDGWFHGSCVGITETQASIIDTYYCEKCSKTHGPLKLKPRRTVQHQNYADLDEGRAKSLDDRLVFINNLKSRKFASSEGIITSLQGEALRHEQFEETLFSSPILVKDKAGLGLTVPEAHFSVLDVEALLGSMHPVTVMDVSTQADLREEFVMRSWCEYYLTPPEKRSRVLNVISLEFSQTRLSPLVCAPAVVREIDWVDHCWPHDVPGKPKVQKYCLMGTQGSYTDFHVDFGGTSVWYHVVKGEKVFYLIPPTAENFRLFEKWSNSPGQNEIFFGDVAEKCFQCRILPGQTFFIPSGWIHAVLTPRDSLVFGGNFLHRYSIPMQLRVYHMERMLKTSARFLVPSFETLHWFVASHLIRELQGKRRRSQSVAVYLMEGLRCLHDTLAMWSSRDDSFRHKAQVPAGLSARQLAEELGKELKLATVVERAVSSSQPLKLKISTKVINGLANKPPPSHREPVKLKLAKGRIVSSSTGLDSVAGSNDRWHPKAGSRHDGLSSHLSGGTSEELSNSDVDVEKDQQSMRFAANLSNHTLGCPPILTHSSYGLEMDSGGYDVEDEPIVDLPDQRAVQDLAPGDSSWHPGNPLDRSGRTRKGSSTKTLSKKRPHPGAAGQGDSPADKSHKPAVAARKRVKKGAATAKQRLGKKLGINKFAFH